MSPEQLALVAASHASVSPVMHRVALGVHDQLVAADPSLAEMLPSDRQALAGRVGHELSHLLSLLDDLDAMRAQAAELGAAHRGYGVTARHYRAFGDALASSLEGELGGEWAPDVADAWRLAFALLAQMMLDGASAAPHPRA